MYSNGKNILAGIDEENINSVRPSWVGQLQPMQEQSEQHSDDKIITSGWKGKMRNAN